MARRQPHARSHLNTFAARPQARLQERPISADCDHAIHHRLGLSPTRPALRMVSCLQVLQARYQTSSDTAPVQDDQGRDRYSKQFA